MHDDISFVSMAEAARELKVTKARISQLLSAGLLKGTLVEGRRMIDVSSIEAYRRGSSGASSLLRKKQFTLMSAQYEIARIDYDDRRNNPLSVLEIVDPARMPFGTITSNDTIKTREFNDWWRHRSVPNTRPGLMRKLDEFGLTDASGLPVRNLGLSLSDCYWLRPEDQSALSWDAINYFDNDFEGADSNRWDEWLGAIGLDSPDNTSEGELPKRWGIKDGMRVLIKGCGFDDQRPYNEAVATALYRRLLDAGAFVTYEITRVSDRAACMCPCFLGAHEEYIPAVYVKNGIGNTRGASTYDRFARYAGRWTGDEEEARLALSQMIVCDAIIANTDRHWRNFGFVRSVDTLQMRPAPIFDSGNSLWCQKSTVDLKQGDWTFSARPFDINPDRQLAMADRLDWFDSSRLSDFVDEAMAILSQSESATRDGRLDLLAQGLKLRVETVSAAVKTLRHVPR